MPIYDETTASVRYPIGRAHDELESGARLQIGKIYDETNTGTRSLVYQSTLDIFNPASVGWVIHQGNTAVYHDIITVTASGVNQYSAARTATPVNLKGFSTLKATAALQESSHGGLVYITMSSNTVMPYTSVAYWPAVGAPQEQAVSLAPYQGSYYLWFVCWSDSALGRGYMNKMFAE